MRSLFGILTAAIVLVLVPTTAAFANAECGCEKGLLNAEVRSESRVSERALDRVCHGHVE